MAVPREVWRAAGHLKRTCLLLICLLSALPPSLSASQALLEAEAEASSVELTVYWLSISEWNSYSGAFNDHLGNAVNAHCATNYSRCGLNATSIYTADQVHQLPGYPHADGADLELNVYVKHPVGHSAAADAENELVLPFSALLTVLSQELDNLGDTMGTSIRSLNGEATRIRPRGTINAVVIPLTCVLTLILLLVTVLLYRKSAKARLSALLEAKKARADKEIKADGPNTRGDNSKHSVRSSSVAPYDSTAVDAEQDMRKVDERSTTRMLTYDDRLSQSTTLPLSVAGGDSSSHSFSRHPPSTDHSTSNTHRPPPQHHHDRHLSPLRQDHTAIYPAHMKHPNLPPSGHQLGGRNLPALPTPTGDPLRRPPNPMNPNLNDGESYRYGNQHQYYGDSVDGVSDGERSHRRRSKKKKKKKSRSRDTAEEDED